MTAKELAKMLIEANKTGRNLYMNQERPKNSQRIIGVKQRNGRARFQLLSTGFWYEVHPCLTFDIR